MPVSQCILADSELMASISYTACKQKNQLRIFCVILVNELNIHLYENGFSGCRHKFKNWQKCLNLLSLSTIKKLEYVLPFFIGLKTSCIF